MKFQAVLFDMDGTLICSGHVWDRATRAVLPGLGIHLTEEEYYSLGGTLLHDLLADKGYNDEMIQKVRQRRDEMLLPLFREETTWEEGAVELLHDLGGIPTAIVTSTHLLVMDAIDEAIDIRSKVRTTVIAEDVAPRYKPDPLGLLIACERLGVEPSKCVFIGDQRSDLAAAKAAKMTGILIRGPFTSPDIVYEPAINHLGELKPLLC